MGDSKPVYLTESDINLLQDLLQIEITDTLIRTKDSNDDTIFDLGYIGQMKAIREKLYV